MVSSPSFWVGLQVEQSHNRDRPHCEMNLKKYPENIPTMQVVANLTYGCHLLLEPASPLHPPRLLWLK